MYQDDHVGGIGKGQIGDGSNTPIELPQYPEPKPRPHFYRLSPGWDTRAR